MHGSLSHTPSKLIWTILALAAALLLIGLFSVPTRAEEDMKPVPACAEFCGEALAFDANPDLEAAFSNALFKARESLKVPGLSAAVYAGQTPVWAGAAGYADIASATLADTRTKFRLGSTSKTLFAALTYRLVDQGVIDPAAPISTYLPDLPEAYRALTLKGLLSHTAGVRGYKSLPAPVRHEFFLDDPYDSAAAALEVFIDDALAYEPGAGFGYSVWGYVLASAALEAATGKVLPVLIEDELLIPLDLNDTAAEFAGRNEERLATFYGTEGGLYEMAPKTNTSVKWAAGGLIAKPLDIARFGGLLASGGVVSKESLEAMWTPVLLEDGTVNEQNYGQGFRIERPSMRVGADAHLTAVHHGGVTFGGVSFLLIVPEKGLAISVQANTPEPAARQGVEDLAYELARIYLAADTAE